MLKIDKKMNLVVPIYGDPATDGGDPAVAAYVHAVPLPAEVVDKHFMVLAQTFTAIFGMGLGAISGPSVAMRVLKRTAMTAGTWEGPDGVEVGVVEEIRRTTSVISMGTNGWESVPLPVAVDRKVIADEDRQEVENAIAFFTVGSAMLPRNARRAMLERAADLWGARLSSSDSMDFTLSLKTSTATASFGEKESASAAPGPEAPAANAVVDGKPSSVPF